MYSLQALGGNIRQARKAHKLSASTLAARSGVHRNTLQALETGKGNIELSKLLSICSELGLELLLVPRAAADQRAGEANGMTQATELTQRLQTLMRSTP